MSLIKALKAMLTVKAVRISQVNVAGEIQRVLLDSGSNAVLRPRSTHDKEKVVTVTLANDVTTEMSQDESTGSIITEAGVQAIIPAIPSYNLRGWLPQEVEGELRLVRDGKVGEREC